MFSSSENNCVTPVESELEIEGMGTQREKSPGELKGFVVLEEWTKSK